MKASFCRHPERSVSKETSQVELKAYPVSSEHPPREVHSDSSDHTRFRSQESMIEEGNFHEELRKSSSLDIVIVGFRNSSNPRVRRAVGGDVEFERLHDIILSATARWRVNRLKKYSQTT